MAEFNADIKLKVAVENLEASVRKVENAFKKVQDYRVKLKVDGQNELKSLGNSFKRLGQIVKTSGVVTAVAAITGSLQSLNNLPLIGGGLNTSALGEVVSKLGAFSNAAADAAASAPGLAAAIAASTAALVAFAPQIARAVKDTAKIGRVAAEAQVPINNLLTMLGAASSGGNLGGFGDAAQGVEEYRRRIHELNESVSNLRSRSESLQSTLNKYNSSSSTAEKIATKLVDVNARLNNELREQADLLRRVSGVTVTELEATKGRKSIETKQKRDQFLARQEGELNQVRKSLNELAKAQAEVDNARLNARAEQEQIRQEQMIRAANDETIRSLERRLAIEEKIANVRSARAAREANQRAQFLAGNPNQYGQGAVGPQSGRFDAIQASIRATQQRLSINQQLQKVAAGTRFEFLKQVAVLEQLAKIGQQINRSTEEELKKQRRLNRELKVRKGREKQRANNQRLESIALGVGFPLLFGGGAGSVLGSLAGSFVGSGFGGQILGGAIGQSIDQAISSIAELGQALNPLSGDVNAVLAAAGEADTELGQLISSLEDSARATELAADVLASKIGQEGVDNLARFGEETAELGQKLTVLGTAIASLVAGPLTAFIEKINEGLNSPQAQQIQALDVAKRDFRAGKASPEITALFEERNNLEGSQQERIARRLEIDKEIVAILKQQNVEREEAIRLAAEASEIDEGKLAAGYATERVLRAQIEAEKLGNDLTKDTVYENEKKILLLQYYEELQRIVNQNLDKELEKQEMINAELAYRAKLAGLESKRNTALNKPPRGGGSGVDKEAQAQKAIASEIAKQFELETKLATIGVTKLEKINIELERLDQKQAFKQKELELSTEDARVLAAKLETLNLETNILRQQLELQRQRLQLEEKLQSLKDNQDIASIQRGLSQELANLQLPTGDVFGDEQAKLKLQQEQRYANVMADINDQIEQQKLLSTSADAAIAEAAERKIATLERQKAVYETMLPAIAQAEQNQLKFNQTLSMVEGPVNAFVSGLTSGLQGIIDGTMSAEEAFANMLKGMADALIQTATQMIAQYIAIGIARAFAGMGGNTFSGQHGTNYYNPTTGLGNAGPNFGLAEGGYVTGPTSSFVGESGEPEYVIPASKMQGAMSRYSSGARGDAVLAGADSDSGYGETTIADVPMSININGGVTQMGGQDYIRKDELPSIINQSSKAGEARALRRLRQSPSTRRSIGL